MIVEQVLNVLPLNFVTNISSAQGMPTFGDLAGRLELWETKDQKYNQARGWGGVSRSIQEIIPLSQIPGQQLQKYKWFKSWFRD